VDCALTGYRTDIAHTEQVKRLRDASAQLDAVTGSNNAVSSVPMSAPGGAPMGNAMDAAIEQATRYNQVVAAARVDEQIAGVKQVMLDKVAICLTNRGYQRFALTEDQRRALNKLPVGSAQRHQYLWSLARDPAVLAAQQPKEGSAR
jgi:hypothetical protein